VLLVWRSYTYWLCQLLVLVPTCVGKRQGTGGVIHWPCLCRLCAVEIDYASRSSRGKGAKQQILLNPGGIHGISAGCGAASPRHCAASTRVSDSFFKKRRRHTHQPHLHTRQHYPNWSHSLQEHILAKHAARRPRRKFVSVRPPPHSVAYLCEVWPSVCEMAHNNIQYRCGARLIRCRAGSGLRRLCSAAARPLCCAAAWLTMFQRYSELIATLMCLFAVRSTTTTFTSTGT
jgi:hypothetical protein